MTFDIDGVLCDSLRSRQFAWRQAMESTGLRLGPLDAAWLGLPLEDILKSQGVILEKERLRFAAHFNKILNNSKDENFYDGAKPFIQGLLLNPRVTLAFFSGRPRSRIENVIEKLGLPIGTPFISADGKMAPAKPSGFGLRMISDLYNEYEFSGRYYVGDTDLDCRAADDAGFDFLFAAWGYGHLGESCDKIAFSFTDLFRSVREFTGDD